MTPVLMATTQKQELAEDALRMALVHRRPAPGLILHHDQGSQYTSARYRAKAEDAGLVLSMSRPGFPYDNALAESFFGTLKQELMREHAFNSRDDARRAVFDYIEIFYNRVRMHSALQYRSPVEHEEQLSHLRHVS